LRLCDAAVSGNLLDKGTVVCVFHRTASHFPYQAVLLVLDLLAGDHQMIIMSSRCDVVMQCCLPLMREGFNHNCFENKQIIGYKQMHSWNR
jgi:hypothetical protein